MKTKYLSHPQACAMCRDFKYLQGKSFDGKQAIDLVTVAPYSRILQWQFLQRVIYEGGTPDILNERNPSGRYDVLVVCKTDEEPGFLIKDLRSWLRNAELAFDESRYSCLRNPNIPMNTLMQILG